jgi:Ca-activated chloride channel homolog
MRFLWPSLLWLLLLVPALVGAYLFMLSRRKKSAINYASLMLVRDSIGPGQKIRRHLPPALFLLAMALAIFSLARPTAPIVLPSEHTTLVMAMDVSRSMQASDVEPNRISAAQSAARRFIEELPRNVRLAIVSFAGAAAVVQTPTENRDDLLAALDRFQLQRATATGSGLIMSLAVLFPDLGFDLDAITMNPYEPGTPRGAKPLDSGRKGGSNDGDKSAAAPVTPVAPGSYTSGAIILLSDGRRTTGPDPLMAAKMAADRGVRVYTVGFGTKEGSTITSDEGWSFYVRLDEETLKAIAKITGAEYFHAGSAADLRKVYEGLSAKFSMERKDTEISALFGALSALLIATAAMLSLLWFYRRN